MIVQVLSFGASVFREPVQPAPIFVPLGAPTGYADAGEHDRSKAPVRSRRYIGFLSRMRQLAPGQPMGALIVASRGI